MPILKKISNGVKHKNEEQLLRQIQAIVESSIDAIISLTLDGIITSWNGGAVKMFGYTAKEAIGKSILFLFPSEMSREVPALIKKVRAGEVIADHDSVRLRKDGTKIDIAFSASLIKTKDGKIIGVSCIERDITERKKAECHIEELNSVRSKFIEIISHQLGTPLTAINWNLETLLNGDFGKLEETQRKFLQSTYVASTKITHRIHNLLAAMDVEEGRVRYVTEDVDLNNICIGVMNESLKECELRDISCKYVPAASNVKIIRGDGEKIRMAIAALVENAIRYTKEKGKVTVKLRSKNNVIRFEIIDTGIGIPQAEKKMIFDRFFRASNASVMQPDAFGLGLFVAKNFIEQHGGKIGFESKEGKGSTFWFEIPIKSDK